MNEKRKDSGALLRQEIGTAVHFCVGISTSMHHTEIPLRECVFTVDEANLLGNVGCMVATISELRLLFTKAINSKLYIIAEERGRQGVWRPSFGEKT